MFLPIAVLLAVGNQAQGSATPGLIPHELVAALESNAKQLNGLELRGSHQRKLLGGPEVLKELGTPEPEDSFCQLVSFRIKLGGARLHEEQRYPPGKFNPPDSVHQRAFDSEKVYAGSAHPVGDGSPGMLIIHTPKSLAEDQDTIGRIFELKYIEAAGYKVPQNVGDLQRGIQSLVLAKLSEGTLISAAASHREGREVFVVEIQYPDPWMSTRRSNIETDPAFEFNGESKAVQQRLEKERRTLVGATRVTRVVLDPSLNYAAVEIREARGNSGAMMFETRNSNFVDMGEGLWLPKTSEITSYANETRPTYTTKAPAYVTTITLEELKHRQFAADDFRVWFDLPGLSVNDYTHATASPGRPFAYRVPGDIGQFGDRRFRVILIVLNVIVLIGLVGLRVWRRCHRASI
jgi:hypothetical protein